nr:MAG TPA: hypothetical protein [Caudoviricetes sp.]
MYRQNLKKPNISRYMDGKCREFNDTITRGWYSEISESLKVGA